MERILPLLDMMFDNYQSIGEESGLMQKSDRTMQGEGVIFPIHKILSYIHSFSDCSKLGWHGKKVTYLSFMCEVLTPLTFSVPTVM